MTLTRDPDIRDDKNAAQNTKRFWYVVLPTSPMLLTAFIAPLYGFNALIEPLNKIFSPGEANKGWSGSIIGAILFLGLGSGALLLPKIKTFIPNVRLLMFILISTIGLSIAIGALACWLQWYWLLIVGFSLLMGLCMSNFYSLVAFYLVSWGQQVNRVGLITGVMGLWFGIWAAIYSYFAPIVFQTTGVIYGLLLSALFVVPAMIGIFLMREPKSDDASTKIITPEKATPDLGMKGILSTTSFWIFFVFFLLFLMPGFGFKIIVQAMTVEVFHVTQESSSIIAVAFLASYGLARFVFGAIADKLRLKPIYLVFCSVQCLSLLGAAIVLQLLAGPLLFTILMCITGVMFGAGKCLWTVMLVSMYGPINYTHAVRASLPAFGLAGLFGPLTLAFALRSSNVVDSTAIWFYAAAFALAICFCLIWILRRYDYEALAQHQPQQLRLRLCKRDKYSWF